MLRYLKQSIILTVITILMFGVGFPLLIWGIGQLIPGKSEGSPIVENGKVMGFENVGQKFTDDKYFNGRPSAVNYNAASTGGSNMGPANPDYLAAVQSRIDTFMAHNPEINKKDIPSDLVTASGSGIDPNISVQAAIVQIPRISKLRKMPEKKLTELVEKYSETPIFGFFGIESVNVLKLNLALDGTLK